MVGGIVVAAVDSSAGVTVAWDVSWDAEEDRDEEEDDEEEDDDDEGVLRQKSSVTGEAILRLELSCSALLCELAESPELIESPAEERCVLPSSLLL